MNLNAANSVRLIIAPSGRALLLGAVPVGDVPVGGLLVGDVLVGVSKTGEGPVC